MHIVIAKMSGNGVAVKCPTDWYTNGVGDFVGSNSTADMKEDGSLFCYKCGQLVPANKVEGKGGDND